MTLYPQGKSPGVHQTRAWVGPQEGCCEKEKKSNFLMKIKSKEIKE
jgi:hypothetical protein